MPSIRAGGRCCMWAAAALIARTSCASWLRAPASLWPRPSWASGPSPKATRLRCRCPALWLLVPSSQSILQHDGCSGKGLRSVRAAMSRLVCLQMLGMHGTVAANYAVDKADLLLAIGVRFDDRVTGKLEAFAARARIVHIDIDPAEINKNKVSHITVCANARPSLQVTSDLSVNAMCRLTAHLWFSCSHMCYLIVLANTLSGTSGHAMPNNSQLDC